MASLARNIGAAVLGWVTMAVGVFILMTALWMFLGADGAFAPGSWAVSWSWTMGSVGIGLVAAIAGGLVCAKIADGPWGVRLLVAIVVVLGILVAVGEMELTGFEGAAAAGGTELGPRPDDVDMIEAMSSAQQPLWLTWLNPMLGAVGAILGARMIRSSAG